MTQLANISARIRMYDLLRLSPENRMAGIKRLSEVSQYTAPVGRVEVLFFPLFINLVIGVKRDRFLSGLELAWIFSSDFYCLLAVIPKNPSLVQSTRSQMA